LLVFVDSDARLPTRTFLREFTAPLSRAEVGCVTCYPMYRGGRDVGALLLAGMVNLDLLGIFALHAAWGNGRFANGSCMALPRDVRDRCGGLEALNGYLLMDSRLAQRVRELGLRVALHRKPVLIERAHVSLDEMWSQSIRWQVGIKRFLSPLAWMGFGWL